MSYDKPGDEKNELNESQPASYNSFAGKKVRIHNSFADQENEMIAYWASVTPLQRFAHLYEMVQQSFKLTKDKTAKSGAPRKITIIKYES